ncbi:RNase H domain-containing protein [Abeliophyllum distichum]|uniref:RNase H domain-containing protein n=1 Tax=Abeliophyllum distichum TaxID=126358 RepID=A0ABD1PDZ4_9LAMI
MAACSYREQYSGCISYDMEFDYSDHGFLFLLEIVAGAYTSGCGDPETDRESYGIETSFISPSDRARIPVSLPGLEILGNDAKHRDIAMEPRRIIWRVYHTISLLHTGRLFRHIHWRGDMDIAPIFGVIITTPSHPPPTLVFWRTPPVGSYKINTDGCVKDGFASGGGIIRDSSGQCIRAFFSFYGDCTILEAELRAILDGIILAQRLGLSVLWVESDSTLAIHCITKGGGPWHIQATIRHIRHLLALDRDTITHIYREGNQVADLLASEGWDRRSYHEYSSQDLPRRHRSLVQIDRFGLPTVRGL